MIKCSYQNMFYNLVECASCEQATTRSTYQNHNGLCYECRMIFKRLGLYNE